MKNTVLTHPGLVEWRLRTAPGLMPHMWYVAWFPLFGPCEVGLDNATYDLPAHTNGYSYHVNGFTLSRDAFEKARGR